MCAPLLAAATVASAATSAYGAYAQGQSESKMNKYQADLLGQQAQLNERQANQNIQLNEIEAQDQTARAQRRNMVLAGTQKAAQAANGTAGSGTALDLALDSLDTAQKDEMTIRYNADLKNWATKEGLKGENWKLGEESHMYKMAAKNASTAGYIKAGSSLLGSATTVSKAFKLGKTP